MPLLSPKKLTREHRTIWPLWIGCGRVWKVAGRPAEGGTPKYARISANKILRLAHALLRMTIGHVQVLVGKGILRLARRGGLAQNDNRTGEAPVPPKAKIPRFPRSGDS